MSENKKKRSKTEVNVRNEKVKVQVMNKFASAKKPAKISILVFKS